MNSVIFGNNKFSHYETLGGGSGGEEEVGQEGASTVQVHMTNTVTDPEILESRFPVRLVAFRRRTGSGGDGTWPGGDGIEREYLFEEETQLSLLTQSRVLAPQGISGGESGMCGEQFLIRMDETRKQWISLNRQPCTREIALSFEHGGGGAGKAELLA